MLNRDYKSLDPASLHALAARWDPEARISRLLGDVENLVWQAEGRQRFVLRMTHQSHRSHAALDAELAWLEALLQARLPVCRPLPGLEGKRLVPWQIDGEQFEVAAFAWLDGEAPGPGREFWQPPMIQALGKLAARLHLHALRLSPEQLQARPHWATNFMQNPASYLSPDETWLLSLIEGCRSQLEALPQGPEHYGLIHGDMHGGNFLVRDTEIQLFDFDDSHLGWHAQDLALILYGALPRDSGSGSFAQWFLDELKKGYRTVRAWPELYNEAQDLFLHWRDLQLVCFILRRWPGGSGRPESATRALERLKARLQAGQSILEA